MKHRRKYTSWLVNFIKARNDLIAIEEMEEEELETIRKDLRRRKKQQ